MSLTIKKPQVAKRLEEFVQVTAESKTDAPRKGLEKRSRGLASDSHACAGEEPQEQTRRPAMPKIVVVGSFVVGITFGVARMPAPGETLKSDTFDLGPGGKGTNQGALTIWNPAPAKRVSAELLSNVDLLTPNETELRILLGLAPDDPTPTLDLARQLLDFGIKRIVVTKGSHVKGLTAYSARTHWILDLFGCPSQEADGHAMNLLCRNQSVDIL